VHLFPRSLEEECRLLPPGGNELKGDGLSPVGRAGHLGGGERLMGVAEAVGDGGGLDSAIGDGGTAAARIRRSAAVRSPAKAIRDNGRWGRGGGGR
jgi:hypothetical protein